MSDSVNFDRMVEREREIKHLLEECQMLKKRISDREKELVEALNELTVSPIASPASPRQVTIVTPVAKPPSALRSVRASIGWLGVAADTALFMSAAL